jgi:hypothetical protein
MIYRTIIIISLITLSPLIILWVATQLFMFLKPISNFVHLTPLVICAPLIHRVTRLHVTPPRSLHSVSHSVGKFSLAYPGSFASLLKRDCSKPEETSSGHERAFPWLSCELCLTPCAGNPTAGSLMTSWQAIQITNLPWIVSVRPGASQARICKTERVTSYRNGKRNEL